MSEQLLRAIEMVQSEIEHHSDLILKNEGQTKPSLIEPILGALGWRVNEVGRVRHQFPLDNKFVDYALMREGKPVVLVEAKKLGVNLDDRPLDQLSIYWSRCKAETAILTNGAEWRVYRPWLKTSKLEE